MGWWEEEGKDFLPLSRAFQNTTHTDTTSINTRQPRPCSWERNWPKSTPGYFGKALRTCVSCKCFFLPSALLTKRRSYCPQWEPLERQRGSRFPGKRTEPRNPGVWPRAIGRKRGYRGLSPYCVPGVLFVLYPCETRSGEPETKTQRWNLI